MNRWIFVLCCVVFLGHYSRAGESLLYCVRTGEMKESQVLPRTDIFAVNPETGKQRLAFSDARSEFLLLPGSDAQVDVVAAGGRIFARGMDRKLYTNGHWDNPAALYELSTNGSGKARKLFEIQPEATMGSNIRMLFISPTGAKIGYIRISKGKPYLFLHETSTGRLLRKIDLTDDVSDLSVTTIGWTPDGERLFFTLDRTDEDDNWMEPGSLMGSYVMKEDGSGRLRVAPEAEMHPSRPGLNSNSAFSAVLLGALPDGRYLVRDLQTGPPSAHPGTYVYIMDTATKVQKTLRVDVPGELYPFRLSRSGSELAIVATERKSDAAEGLTNTKTLWVFDLESGKERKLLSFTAKQDGSKWMGLVGWLGNR